MHELGTHELFVNERVSQDEAAAAASHAEGGEFAFTKKVLSLEK